MISIDDIKDNSDIVINNLTFIYDYAQQNNIQNFVELKNVFPDKIIEACCKIVSINTGKKRANREEVKKLNKINKMNNTKKNKKYYIRRVMFVDQI